MPFVSELGIPCHMPLFIKTRKQDNLAYKRGKILNSSVIDYLINPQ